MRSSMICALGKKAALALVVLLILVMADGHLPKPSALWAQEDTTPPRVTRLMFIASNDSIDGIYTVGEELYAWVVFSERVRVVGTPRLKIQLDNGKHDYAPLEATDHWYFRYRVPEGVSATQGISTLGNPIDLNGGSIRDYAGNDAILSHPGTPVDSEFVIDGIRPTVETLEITSSPGSDNTYGVGDLIEVSVTFSENIRVPNNSGKVYGEDYNWKPILNLIVGEDHRTAYFAGVDKKVVKFTYEVSSGDYAPDGIAIPPNGLSRNQTHPTSDFAGAVIEDDVGNGRVGQTNWADLSHTALLSDSEHKVDARGGLPCANEIADNGTVSGSWAAGCESLTRDQRYARYYSFTLDAESVVTIDLRSSIDTYLYLRRGSDFRFGEAQYFHDNRGGTNTRISRSLRAGDWTIEATTTYINRSGPFSVGITGITKTTSDPEITISGGSGITEGGTASFTITASPVPSSPITVNIGVSENGDFGASGAATVTVSGATTTYTITTTDDSDDEADGSVTATLQTGQGYTVSSTQGAATVSVTDNDLPPPTPEVNVTGAVSGPEGQDVTFTLTANPAPAANLPVSVTVTASGDYGVSTGTWVETIPTGGSVVVTLTTTDDSTDEPNGSVTLTLNGGQGYTVGSLSSETVTVTDNDEPRQPLLLPDPEVSITAGSGITEGGTASFTITASPAPASPITVNVGVSETGDFGASGAATVSVSGATTTYTVTTSDDTTDEADGSVTATLQTGSGYTVSSIQGAATVSVSDDDAPLQQQQPSCNVQLPADAPTVDEITGWRDEYPNDPAHVGKWNRVLVALGEDVGDSSVTPMTLAEAKAINSQINNSRWSRVADLLEALAQCWPEVSIAAGSGITEGGTASFTITANPAPASPITVKVGVSENGDFGVSGAATVTVSGATTTYTVTTTDDGADEADGSVTATLQTGSGYTVSSIQGTATVAVSDDDAPLQQQQPSCNVQLPADAPTVDEITGWRDEYPNDPAHVGKWNRVLVALGEDVGDSSVTPMTLAEAKAINSQINNSRWSRVADLLEALAQCWPEVSIAGGSGITEGGTASFTITANPAPSSPITVKVGVSENGDFGVSGAATVTVSGATTTYTVTTTDDGADEADGSVTATLQSGSGYTVSSIQGTATVAVADDDLPPPTPEVNVTSAVSGPEGQDVTFTLTANPAPGANLPVSVTVTASGDYGVSTGTWVETIPTGGSVVVTLTTTDDSTDEPNGSVTLTLNGGQGYTVGSLSSETVTVTDNDEPRQPLLLPDPEVSITAGSGITEGGTATFTITASPAPSSPITVNVGVSENGDFGASGAATVQVSGASTTYTVTTINDNADEADGLVTATLQTGSGYTVSSSQGVATVAVSDDDVPEVSITAGSGITEGGAATFTITASPAPPSPITVKVGVSENGDFGASGSATVTVGGASTTYTVTTINDNADEADGSVTATLQTGSGYTVSSSQGAATVAVADDDVPEVSITAGSGITEGGTASFTITASPAPASPITVKVGVSEDGDFGASGSATVTVSGASTTYTVTTTNDNADEADGSVTATLQSGSGYTVSSSQGAATVAVSDDDVPTDGNSDTLTVSVADAESAGPGEFLRFTVSASETAQQDVTVTFDVSNVGGLIQGLDYCILASDEEPGANFRCMFLPYEHDNEGGQVTIAAGEDSATVYIWIDRDARVPSGQPQVFVSLTEVDGAKGITENLASGRVTR